jgi:hypothetical protein
MTQNFFSHKNQYVYKNVKFDADFASVEKVAKKLMQKVAKTHAQKLLTKKAKEK